MHKFGTLLLLTFSFTVFAVSTQRVVSVSTGFTNAKGDRFTIEPISQNSQTGEIKGATIDLNGLKIETIYSDEYRPILEKEILTDDNGVIIAEYSTQYEYNAMGNITKTTDALGNFKTKEYNSINKVSATTDENGNRTSFEYDSRGYLFKTEFPDGSTESKLYDGNGNKIAKINRANRTTKTIYDALNRVKAVVQPDNTPATDADNPTQTNNYDPAGRLISVIDANGNEIHFEYDPVGNRTKIIDPLGNENRFIYNNRYQKVQSIDALGRVTKYEYDLLGNLLRTIYPDNTLNDDSDNLFSLSTYDELSRKVSQTDLEGNSTLYEFNKGGNLTAVIDALNQRTEFTYDQRGYKTSQTDANGHTTYWSYDALGRVSSKTLPEGQSESYSYDPVGNMVSKIDFNGDETRYEYNNLNQQTKIIYADNTEALINYTLTGQVASITQPYGTTNYQYNEQDKLIRIDYPNNQFISYLYDKNGNRTQLKTANQTVNYTFDALNRIKTVSNADGTTSYDYNAIGRVSQQTNTNGTVVSYSYDQLNRLVSLVHTDSSDNVIASYQYTLTGNGNREHIIEASGREVSYIYDKLNRLIREEITDPFSGNQVSEFTYDKAGNRLQQIKNGETTTYIYNKNDQLLSETTSNSVTTYAYDNNGNTLSKSVDGVIQSSYLYDKRNRLIEASTPSGMVFYTYDINGIRLSQTINGITTNFIIDPNRSYAQVIEELDENNNLKASYLYGADLVSQTNNDGTLTYGYDGLGSTRLLTDANGTVQVEYDYEVFGEQSYQFGSADNKYLYTGEQYDENLELYYLRSRYYNPKVGRFQKMDIWQGSQLSPLTLNKYTYVQNNPANMYDPSGLFGLGELMAAARIEGIQASTSTASYRVIVRKLGKNLACIAVEEVVGTAIIESLTGGIYLLQDSNKPYVGRTTNFKRRVAQHTADATKNIQRVMAFFHMPFDRNDQRLVEQFFIDLLDTIDNGANKINSVAEKPKSNNSKKIRKLLKKLDFCK